MSDHIGSLKPDPRNARKHTPRNVGMIAKSMQSHGFGRSVLIANDGTIIAGHATIDAAAEVGIEDMLIVPSDGTRVIAVQRTDIESGTEAADMLGLEDNRSGELAGWDGPRLETFNEQYDLSGLWSDEEFAIALATVPDFEPVGIDEQGRLDEKATATCPECGHVFTP